jgi:hypothetical protein
MITDCPFLELLRRPRARSTHGCGAGINFYEVGKDRERCRVCAVAMLGRMPDCRHLGADAWLEGYSGGAPFIRVELFCGLTGDPLPSLLHCACCQQRLPQSVSLSRPALAPVLTG